MHGYLNKGVQTKLGSKTCVSCSVWCILWIWYVTSFAMKCSFNNAAFFPLQLAVMYHLLVLCVDTSVVEYVALLVSGSGSGYLIVLDVIYPKLDQLQRRVMTLLLKRWNTSNIRRISAATVFAKSVSSIQFR